MQPAISDITVDKSLQQPVYAQLAGKLVVLIKLGALQPGARLPGTRQMAGLLNVHRKTVVRAYEDLLAQGWLESNTGSGTFVAGNLPEIRVEPLNEKIKVRTLADTAAIAGFDFEPAKHLDRELIKTSTAFHLDDGLPDVRLAPLQELSRAYRTQLLTGNPYERLGYADPQGSLWLREELVKHLGVTRNLHVTVDNILVTRGSVMGLYLACAGLIKPGDLVIAGEPGWQGADASFTHAGAQVLKIKVDEYGICVDQLEQICKKQTVRMVYATPHHHYPTTVNLRADRRYQLLRLAEQYGFIIFEDDYDYDFHYLNKPLLPLASSDEAGMVLYCGSFTKTISPAFRVGYLVGPTNVVRHLSKLRRIIDRQGDTMLENAMAELLQNDIIQRHMRKSVRVYRQRRDIFCSLLRSTLSNYLDVQLPEGGMAVWACFDRKIDLIELAQNARKKDLFISNGRMHLSSKNKLNATRLGFASSSITELEYCVKMLSDLMKRL